MQNQILIVSVVGTCLKYNVIMEKYNKHNSINPVLDNVRLKDRVITTLQIRPKQQIQYNCDNSVLHNINTTNQELAHLPLPLLKRFNLIL